ncbi:MAG TPA: hypothetical protein VG106_06210 [Vicinamibacterales bacterium]|nr:hypothetical protein [Vicinamibacterales bacterium]
MLPLGTGNGSFVMSLMANATGALDFLREYTVNGTEAIRARPDGKGETVDSARRPLARRDLSPARVTGMESNSPAALTCGPLTGRRSESAATVDLQNSGRDHVGVSQAGEIAEKVRVAQ